MPRKLPPHVERFRDRHGRIRFYFRIGKGARTPLPTDPTSSEFAEAWEACFSGAIPAKAKPTDRNAPGSMSALILSYKKSAGYVGLRASTKVGYSSRLEAMRSAHGHRLISQMSRGAIIEKILQPYAAMPGAHMDVLRSCAF